MMLGYIGTNPEPQPSEQTPRLQATMGRRTLVDMPSRRPGFHGEYLWELDIAQVQLFALADAIPEAGYSWRPVDDARSFSAVLVHIALGNFALLHLVGARSDSFVDLYGPLDGDRSEQFAAIIRKNVSLQRTVTNKQNVLELLRRSFEAIRQSFSQTSVEHLESIGDYFGEATTVRRVYLRMVAHTHEHMGQAIAYARSCGIRVPWPDPAKNFERKTERAATAKDEGTAQTNGQS
jgi:hypothetical protein